MKTSGSTNKVEKERKKKKNKKKKQPPKTHTKKLGILSDLNFINKNVRHVGDSVASSLPNKEFLKMVS